MPTQSCGPCTLPSNHKPYVFDIVRAQGMQRPILLQQDTAGSIVWANDNETLFYVTKDKLDRPYKVQPIIRGGHSQITSKAEPDA
jgi:protease II